MLDICIYWVSFKYILLDDFYKIPFYTFSRAAAAQLAAFCVSFPTGFLLMMRYLVFTESNLRGRGAVLFRYLVLVLVCLLLNLAFIKFFTEVCHIYAPFAKVITTFFVVGFSYLTQKHFTFRVTRSVLADGRVGCAWRRP